MYNYELTVSNNFSASRRARIQPGRILVVNERDSPYGAGWRPGGVYQLAFNAEDVNTPTDDSVTVCGFRRCRSTVPI